MILVIKIIKIKVGKFRLTTGRSKFDLRSIIQAKAEIWKQWIKDQIQYRKCLARIKKISLKYQIQYRKCSTRIKKISDAELKTWRYKANWSVFYEEATRAQSYPSVHLIYLSATSRRHGSACPRTDCPCNEGQSWKHAFAL